MPGDAKNFFKKGGREKQIRKRGRKKHSNDAEIIPCNTGSAPSASSAAQVADRGRTKRAALPRQLNRRSYSSANELCALKECRQREEGRGETCQGARDRGKRGAIKPPGGLRWEKLLYPLHASRLQPRLILAHVYCNLSLKKKEKKRKKRNFCQCLSLHEIQG